VAYVGVVEGMTADHYPGLERFMLPAAAIAAVLAGSAVARFATFAGGGAASLAVAIALVGIAVPFFDGRVAAAGPERGIAQQAVNTYDAMGAVIRRAGGVRKVFPCRTSRAAVNHSIQTSFAWAINVPLVRVHAVTRTETSLYTPSVAFFAPANRLTGGRPRHFVDGLRGHLLFRLRHWKVYRVTGLDQRRKNACVGS
jgi:hypothetical protein